MTDPRLTTAPAFALTFALAFASGLSAHAEAPVAGAPTRMYAKCWEAMSVPLASKAAPKDRSSPFAAENTWVQITPGEGVTSGAWQCGRVTSISPGDKGKRVVLLALGSPATISLDVRLPPEVPLPFAIDDHIAVRVVVRHIRIHRVVEATLVDDAGRLLLGVSEDGDAAFAPGWRIEKGAVTKTYKPHMRGGAKRRDHGLVMTYGDKGAFTKPGGWRKLVTRDGTFLVSGRAESWTDGPRPPDASSYSTYAIVRLRD